MIPALNDVERRVLGALIEKQVATPEYYPLTLQALTAACNQKNHRDPVMQVEPTEVGAAIDRLMEVAKTDEITVDLETQTVTTPYQDRFVFQMDPFRRDCLMKGQDEIGLTLAMADKIGRYETRMAADRPWL